MLLISLKFNSFKFPPLISKNFINNSYLGNGHWNFKICNCGKIVYCNFSKPSKLILKDISSSSCKFVKLLINNNDGIVFALWSCNLIKVLESFVVNKGIIPVRLLQSQLSFISKHFKFCWTEIKSANPSEISSIALILNDCILQHIWDSW